MGFYAVVDLEMCRVPKAFRTKEYHWAQETIQIGAVLLDEAYEIVDKFSTFVSPQFGKMDSFISDMTGITVRDLKNAPTIQKALQQFVAWLPEDVELVSWSESDRAQIEHEIIGKKLKIERRELLMAKWIDCQKIFDDKIQSTRAYNLTEALNLSDIFYEDGAHDGLVDAYNTALLFAKLRKTPDYEFNRYYTELNQEKEVEHLSSSLGDLLSKLNLGN